MNRNNIEPFLKENFLKYDFFVYGASGFWVGFLCLDDCTIINLAKVLNEYEYEQKFKVLIMNTHFLVAS